MYHLKAYVATIFFWFLALIQHLNPVCLRIPLYSYATHKLVDTLLLLQVNLVFLFPDPEFHNFNFTDNFDDRIWPVNYCDKNSKYYQAQSNHRSCM